ncbi:MAG: ATP-binding cassette domain-containing protein, partial [Propionibacterium sp.]|nr:ATP-binding cassette domain-containing protein [Propionibacterium sp.]
MNSETTRAAVRGTGLTKIYGSGDAEVRALDGVDVAFGARMFSAIMGPSGSGKSTLLHVLAGVDDVTSGEVVLGDTMLTGASDKHLTLLRRERVGFVFQSFNLLPMYTAEQNILLPLDLAGAKPDRAWFDQLIGVLQLGDRLTHLPSELSGGQ